MMENQPCRRWITTNQDEYRDPHTVKINRYLQSEEMGRYEDCMERVYNKDKEEDMKDEARQILCCTEQSHNREGLWVPPDYHLSEEAKCKPSWCRCLARGSKDNPKNWPTCEEPTGDELCECECPTEKRREPIPENSRQKVYSSNYFLDYRDPAFPYIHNKNAIKEILDKRFRDYKEKVDAVDALKEPKITPAPEDPEDRVNFNCMGLHDDEDFPDPKLRRSWKPDERWWREETDDCRKGIVKKYVWSSTYREMNKDGAALPLAVRELPESCIERPPGDPIRRAADKITKSIITLDDEKCQQKFRMAQRCDTMYNRPDLGHDGYFQEQRLCRAKYARCPEGHALPTKENLDLVRKEMLRQPYDKMIPGYGGYECFVTPPVCKIKKILDPRDPYDNMTMYQANYTKHPTEVYASPVQPLKPSDFDKMGIATNPIWTLGRIPLPETKRLSCYLESDSGQCSENLQQ